MTQPSFEQRDGIIWLNGQMVPWRDARIHVLTHGLHYASSLFEGVRAYNGRIFKLQEHTDRLFNSAKIMDMPSQFTHDDINKACEDVLAQNNLKNAYIRPFMWRGAEQMGVGGKNTKVHTAVAAWEWPAPFSDDVLAKGITLKTGPWRRPPPECAPVHAKAAGLYMICTLSKQWADQNGCHDCLFLDWRGYVAEATASNIFLVQNGELHTPVADCFLNGITRQTVIALAKQAGIKVVERHIQPEEFKDTQEVFLTGTAYEIVPVGVINEFTFTPGPVTQKLRDMYYTASGR